MEVPVRCCTLKVFVCVCTRVRMCIEACVVKG